MLLGKATCQIREFTKTLDYRESERNTTEMGDNAFTKERVVQAAVLSKDGCEPNLEFKTFMTHTCICFVTT